VGRIKEKVVTWERDKEDFIWRMVGLNVVVGRYIRW